MQPTHGTTTLPTNSQASRPPSRGSDQRGLITLEWLLIVGAIAGLAATSVLAVQQVLDDTSEVPVDPLVRVLEADIAAAFVGRRRTGGLRRRASWTLCCHTWTRVSQDSLQSRRGVTSFSDVVDLWTPMPWTTPAGPDSIPGNSDDVAARCTVGPRLEPGSR